MPEAMPRPVSVVEVSVPVFARLSPASSTLDGKEPTSQLHSLTTSYAVFLLHNTSARLPTLMVSASVPVLTVFVIPIVSPLTFSFFFFNDTATTEIYTLSLHDALPI